MIKRICPLCERSSELKEYKTLSGKIILLCSYCINQMERINKNLSNINKGI